MHILLSVKTQAPEQGCIASFIKQNGVKWLKFQYNKPRIIGHAFVLFIPCTGGMALSVISTNRQLWFQSRDGPHGILKTTILGYFHIIRSDHCLFLPSGRNPLSVSRVFLQFPALSPWQSDSPSPVDQGGLRLPLRHVPDAAAVRNLVSIEPRRRRRRRRRRMRLLMLLLLMSVQHPHHDPARRTWYEL